jgi:hypothetical protein
MTLKVKILGLGILAIMATGAFSVMNASAVSGGHFTVDAHGTVHGVETAPNHVVHLVSANGSEIGCSTESYNGTISSLTTTSIKITPLWSNCTTTGDGAIVDVIENGCYFEFTSGKTGQTHHTAHFVCPTKSLEISHPNCSIRVPAQTATGVTYETITMNEKHAITLNSTAKVTSHYEGGICIFLGTTQTSEMRGSVTVQATDTLGKPTNLTSTTG